MTPEQIEKLVYELLVKYQQSVGATTDEQRHAFEAGARSALVTLAGDANS